MNSSNAMQAIRPRVTPERVRDFQEWTSHIVRIMAKIEAFRSPPTVKIDVRGGTFTAERADLPAEMEELLRELRGLIDKERVRRFGNDPLEEVAARQAAHSPTTNLGVLQAAAEKNFQQYSLPNGIVSG